MTLRWRDLPRTTRDEVRRLAENGYPHPDPAIQRAAVDWATRVRTVTQWFSAAIAVSLILTLSYSLLTLLGLVLILSMLYWQLAAVRNAEGVERANLEVMINSVPLPAAEPFAARRRFFYPSPDLTALLWAGASVVLTISIQDMINRLPLDALPGRLLEAIRVTAVVICLVPGLIWLLVALLTHRGRGTLVGMDADGVTIPHLGLTFGWADVERVDFGYGMSLAFRLRDADGVLRRAHPKPWRRIQARHVQGALVIPAVLLREPIDKVVAQARALHSASLAGTAAH
ncbi:MAG: hypothetical protein HOU81_27500 [Hamadaea sp.]|uniref:hypothetical protein n=1 Tax=Hamadaea sp. TaxID=2024425 RepID=UPI001795FC64|nr:hypothetical protein [Hamadaea sp.]NUR74573.1 hypothetical protein [Hamadaea sp.]NUT17891.1 hypothetical protein [Hamadaea sp.]